ncbi:MAG: STAS domain-containing protein [Chitinophagaceae bacterium]|nr:MAG: STAS domain-containing protein [Chitinophagaceae bacterium]
MNVKIDTKERFHVITPLNTDLTETMAEAMDAVLIPFLNTDIKNLVLNMDQVKTMDEAIAHKLLQIQQTFYAGDASFVLCGLAKEVESYLDSIELLDILNITPTESEAWDIVQMEEIERELFDDDVL